MQNLDVEHEPIQIRTSPSSTPIEVIDLDTYEPKYCSCPMSNANVVASRPFRIVFAIPATSPRRREDDYILQSLSDVDAVEFEAREKLRLYFARRYRRLRLATLVARTRARVSPRRSPCLLES